MLFFYWEIKDLEKTNILKRLDDNVKEINEKLKIENKLGKLTTFDRKVRYTKNPPSQRLILSTICLVRPWNFDTTKTST